MKNDPTPFPPRNAWKCVVTLQGSTVVKDYRSRPLPVRLVGRVLLSREQRALARLDGLAGVPRVLARPGPYCLEISRLPGKPLEHCVAGEVSEAFLADLGRLFDHMHHRGVAHADAHARNILVDGEHAGLVDFSTALLNASPGHRWAPLFNAAVSLDDWSEYKVKRRWFGGAQPPRMFLLYRILKARRYRQELRDHS